MLKLRRLALATLLALTAGAAAANVLVVRSSGPSAKAYPPGRSLPDNARIALRGGDTLVVLDARGTRTFRGPGTFSPAVAPQAGARTVTASDGRRARIGAVRNAGITAATPTTIWHVDASQSGTFCLADPTEVQLWRADAAAEERLTIAGGGASRTLAWPVGQSTLAWPADLAVVAGTEYRLGRAGLALPARITFRLLTSRPADMNGVAAALIEQGCTQQLDLLVDSVAQR
ncbi:MAG: hypothetical protein ACT4OE_00175 [Sphingosinicella sp.]